MTYKILPLSKQKHTILFHIEYLMWLRSIMNNICFVMPDQFYDKHIWKERNVLCFIVLCVDISIPELSRLESIMIKLKFLRVPFHLEQNTV